MQQELDQDYGFILEVDLEYPDHLHDVHDSFGLAPDRFKVTAEMLSPYTVNKLTF